jgi:putative DNA primase/helicase
MTRTFEDPFEQSKSVVIIRRCDEIKPKPVNWVWPNWIPKKKFGVIAGPPGAAKTTLALKFAATISSGGNWPDGTQAAVGNVLIWTSEDDPDDTIVPRLMRMGADLTRIHYIDKTHERTQRKPRNFNPGTDMPELEQTVKEMANEIGDVSLLILDPVSMAASTTRDSHKQVETRCALQPVINFTQEIGCATIGIGHLTKNTTGKDPLERLNGSGAFGQLARFVL